MRYPNAFDSDLKNACRRGQFPAEVRPWLEVNSDEARRNADSFLRFRCVGYFAVLGPCQTVRPKPNVTE
jgi:hypothetical protein